MKLLFDQNISFRLLKLVQDILPEAQQVRNLNLENASDRSIWEYAKIHGFTIVSFDRDFYDLSLLWGHHSKIIWLRTNIQTTKHLEGLLRTRLSDLEKFMQDEQLACLEIVSFA